MNIDEDRLGLPSLQTIYQSQTSRTFCTPAIDVRGIGIRATQRLRRARPHPDCWPGSASCRREAQE